MRPTPLCACLAVCALVACGGSSSTGGARADADPLAPDADPAAPDADPAAPDADPAAPDAAPVPDAAPLDCVDEMLNNNSGRHNAGEPCMGCHFFGGAPRFSVGGTLFADREGANPLPGATITIVDANGVEHNLVTALNGNFWSTASIAYPIHVQASRCPDAAAMGSAVDSPGDCNLGGCHMANDTNGTIHLPFPP